MDRTSLSMLITFFAVMLLTAEPAFCEEPPSTAASRDPVTEAMLEAKIAEVEAATGIEEQAKSKLVELYRKALSNLKTESSNARSTEQFRQAAEAAPAQLQTLREGMDRADSTPLEATLEVDPSTPLRRIAQFLQKET